LPALLMLSTFGESATGNLYTTYIPVAVVGIVACVNDVTDKRIPLILGAATNLILTTLTGNFLSFFMFSAQWSASWSDILDPTCSLACFPWQHIPQSLQQGYWAHVWPQRII
jgi:hypothetical protein